MAQSNKNPDKEFNKIFNGQVPRSMQDGGTNLDVGCGDIEQAEAGQGLDSLVEQLETSEPAEWVAGGYNAGASDDTPSESAANLGEALYNAGPGPIEQAGENAVGALLQDRRKRNARI
jgi:hypothetical protein